MKIAIPSTEPTLQGDVADKLGAAPYLLIVETSDMSFELMDVHNQAPGPKAVVEILSLVMDKDVQVILVGHISPFILDGLADQDIRIVTQVSGSVVEAVIKYLDDPENGYHSQPERPLSQDQWKAAINKGMHQFGFFWPLVTGVVVLLGLFQAFIPEQRLMSFFSSSALQDSILGALMGSVLAGNPVNSYVIAKSLLGIGVGISGVIALMLTWVSVGLIQLPAEARALGLRFALVRNAAAFLVAIILSVCYSFFPM